MNDNDSSANLTQHPSSMPWPATVIVVTPTTGSYMALVAVKVLIKFLGYVFWEPVESISQVNVNALVPISTVSPTEIPCPSPIVTVMIPTTGS